MSTCRENPVTWFRSREFFEKHSIRIQDTNLPETEKQNSNEYS